ncbi:MAG: ScpA family protein [Pseudomonadota bacterium]
MSNDFRPAPLFQADAAPVHPGGLVVDVDGFEGPLDLLLTLARDQKVDLTRISVLALAEQYLRFIAEARAMRLEVAADYLVMAAWLAYLKSRLLIPDTPDDDEPSGEMMAEELAFRLKRLEAMRNAAKELFKRPQRGRDVFARGMPEALLPEAQVRYQDTLYDLLLAYARERSKAQGQTLTLFRRTAVSLEDARAMLRRFVGDLADWAPLDGFLLAAGIEQEDRRSALASGFSASLELAREGQVEIRQSKTFAPIMVRARARPVDTVSDE